MFDWRQTSLCFFLILIMSLPWSPRAGSFHTRKHQQHQQPLTPLQKTIVDQSLPPQPPPSPPPPPAETAPQPKPLTTHTTKENRNGPKSTTVNHRNGPLKPTNKDPSYESLVQAGQSDETFVKLKIPVYPCTTDIQCYPDRFKNFTIPSDYIYCDNRTLSCVCRDCFVSVNDSCTVERCYRYDNHRNECVNEMKSQKEAFIVSLFLSSTGAANLYIGQIALGYAQFAILLLIFASGCMAYCVKRCCINCCQCFEEECECCDCCEPFWSFCHESCSVICIFLSCTVVVFGLVVIAGWWLADLYSFIENSKLDGDGCALINDL